MKALIKLINKIRIPLLMVLCMMVSLSLSSCGEEVLDLDHPKVDVFVKQLRTGKWMTASPGTGEGHPNGMPKFKMEDIGDLLQYASDLSVISSFPLAPVSYSAGGKLRLGECILWTVETVRLGYHASMGCKMVHTDAENYEGIYFLTDEEVLDAVARYRHWWDSRKLPKTMWTIDPCFDEPLCGSGYMWW